MTKTHDNIDSALPELEKTVVEESQAWVRQNKGNDAELGKYHSPRISSEIADCSMPMTFDHYSHCSLGCMYCFAYFFKSNIPGMKHRLGAVNPMRMIRDMDGKATQKHGRLFYECFYKRKFLLHWGGLADPFCSFEAHNGVGYKLIKALGRRNYPTLFSFKGSSIFHPRFVRLFEKYAEQNNFAFQCSIITSNEELAKRIEIGVPSPTKRLKALRMLSDMGYWTILRLRPFIIGISDDGLDELLHRALDAGIRGISMEFFAMDLRCTEGMVKRYRWIEKLIGCRDIFSYFKRLSPSERGGYMRLNRMVKEPHVRQVYDFCAKHDLVYACSDPDFKELNTSGSCCGMPDKYPKNPLLENWTRSQLTYHLKEARRLYHMSGECKCLRFGEVYGDEPYLDSIEASWEHIGVIGRDGASRNNLTQRILLQEQWNNLRSPANPRNYLHGKVLPVGTDDQGNLIFKYNPMEYEARWSQEGVDLTR